MRALLWLTLGLGVLSPVATATATAAAERGSLDRRSRYAIPVDARSIAVADSFAAHACHWSAVSCEQPAVVYGRAGAPVLACAIETNGGVACWSMAIGDLWTDELQLVRPVADADYVALAVGRAQLCLLNRAGALVCHHYAWNRAADTWVFTEARPRPGAYRAVTAGGQTMCAIALDGGVHCWSEIGVCRNLAETTTPTPVALDCRDLGGSAQIAEATDSDAVAVGVNGGCSRRADGRLQCWGQPAGQAANARQAVSMTQLGKARAIAVTWSGACAVRTSGAITCWPSVSGEAKLPAAPAKGAVSVAVRGETVCWLDESGRARCVAGNGPSEQLADDVAELALGEQLCVRSTDHSVTCWAEPYLRGVRAGDTVASGSLTLALGGGLVTANRAGLFDLGLRGHLLFGPAADMPGRGAHQAWALGAVAELRSRNVETVEPAAGLELHTLLTRRGPWLGLTAVGGYAFRPRHSEPVVGLTAAILGIGPVWRGHDYVQGPWLHNFSIGLYLGGRYGLDRGRLELTAGLEAEILAPWAALGR